MASEAYDSAEEASISSYESDILEDLLERYTITCKPEVCLKLRRGLRSVQVGANCTFAGPSRHWCFLVKPVERQAFAGRSPSTWWRKAAILPAEKTVEIFSNKWRITDFVRFQLAAGYDWGINRPSINWRLCTKWSIGGKFGRKEQLRVTDDVTARLHWKVDLFVPEMEGRFGGGAAGAAGGAAGGVHVERGHCHVEIPRVDLVVRLDRLVPGAAGQAPASALTLGGADPPPDECERGL